MKQVTVHDGMDVERGEYLSIDGRSCSHYGKRSISLGRGNRINSSGWMYIIGGSGGESGVGGANRDGRKEDEEGKAEREMHTHTYEIIGLAK